MRLGSYSYKGAPALKNCRINWGVGARALGFHYGKYFQFKPPVASYQDFLSHKAGGYDSLNVVKNHLPLIAELQWGSPPQPHFVVATGIATENDNLYINDPGASTGHTKLFETYVPGTKHKPENTYKIVGFHTFSR